MRPVPQPVTAPHDHLRTDQTGRKTEGRLEGILEGEQKGKQEAARIFLARMLAGKFRIDPEPFLPLLDGLEFSMYEQLSDKILEAESIEEIRLWLENASRN